LQAQSLRTIPANEQQNIGRTGTAVSAHSFVHIAYAEYRTISRLRKISVSRIVKHYFLRFFCPFQHAESREKHGFMRFSGLLYNMHNANCTEKTGHFSLF